MNILGIMSRGDGTSACLVMDGEVVAAVEEERLNRKKRTRLFPRRAIKFCLEQGGITIRDVDKVVMKEALNVFVSRNYLKAVLNNLSINILSYPYQIFRDKKLAERKFKQYFDYCPPVEYFDHHLSHASSAYRLSGFDECAILTIDGVGEFNTATISYAKGGKIKKLKEYLYPNSLGHFYTYATWKCGFDDGQEGKLMGLAPFGKPSYMKEMREIVKLKYGKKGELKMTVDLAKIANWKFSFGEYYMGSMKVDEMPDEVKDLARSVQQRLEEAGVALAKETYRLTGYKKLCMAGGSTLNCDMNAKILQQDFVDEVFIHPAANDAGCAMGAALETANSPVIRMGGSYFGPEYSDEEIEAQLKESKVMEYATKMENIAEYVGKELLPKGYIVGWFQGKCEWGPRALGNRSIVADPGNPEMQDRVNHFVKHREAFRPFAPAVLHEEGHRYYKDYVESPYMLLTFEVLPDAKDKVISAYHVDNTARIQTVTREQNPMYYDMIKAFFKATGNANILNTSFNIAGEPIVCSPRDAIKTFFGCGLDYLAIGNWLVTKNRGEAK